MNDDIFTRTGEIRYGRVFDYYRLYMEEFEINGKSSLETGFKHDIRSIIASLNLKDGYMRYINDFIKDQIEIVNLDEKNEIRIILTKFAINYINIVRKSSGVVEISINHEGLKNVIDDIDMIIKQEEKDYDELQLLYNQYRQKMTNKHIEIEKIITEIQDESMSTGWIRKIEKFFYDSYNKTVNKKIKKRQNELGELDNVFRKTRESLSLKDENIRSLYSIKKFFEFVNTKRGYSLFITTIKNFLKDDENRYQIIHSSPETSFRQTNNSFYKSFIDGYRE